MKRSLGTMEDESTTSFPSVLCCVCAGPMPPNDSAMCSNCLRSDVDITDGFSRHLVLPHCRGCNRYNSPPWVRCELESRELLAVCLKKIKGLKKQVKLIDANFLYTEAHSKRVKVKLTVQKEITNGAIVQHDFVIEFVVQNNQCDDCKRGYTPHLWVATCQVRQKSDHRRSLYFLEQLILKHDAMDKILQVTQAREGFDFFFSSKSHCNAFTNFVESHFPSTRKEAKQLVTHDAKSNTFKFKYSCLVDLCTVCKDDLIFFTPKLRSQHGGLGSLLLATKVSTGITLIDPMTLQSAFIAKVKYYENPFYPVCTRRHLTEFVVLDVETETIEESKITPQKRLGERKHFQLCQIELARIADFGVNDDRITVRSHLGKHLHAGDHVLGYDLRTINASGIDDEVLQEATSQFTVILVKKKFKTSQKKRIERRKWKLKRMQVENDEGLIRVKDNVKDEQDFNDFQDDLEEDPDLRREVNLYKDPDRIRAANADGEENEENKMNDSDEEDSESDSDDVPEVPLAELLDGLHINEDSDEDDEEGLIFPDGSKIPACPMSDDDDI